METLEQAPASRTDAPLLAARGILAFAQIDWQGTWYSRHQILSRLARTCPVVVFERPPDARDVLAGRARSRPALEAVAPGIWRYRAPRGLPQLYRPAAAARLLAALQDRHLRTALRSIGLRAPLHYVFNPDYADVVARWPDAFTVYHAYDKYSAYQDAPSERVDAMEAAIVSRARLAIASSRVLAADIEERCGRPVHHVPHAVDVDFFAPASPAEPEAQELTEIARPRIGYVARMDERTDDRALRRIAEARPDWSLVIVGGESFSSEEDAARYRALTELPNVHALGPRPREDVPAILSALDVCLLAYRTDNWGRWVQPIKAYEYLACGRPVVSAAIDAARDFGDLVRVVDGAEGWVPAIEAVLSEETEASAARRVAWARANTWDRRVEQLVALIEERLAEERRSDG
jgi:glycosyltransferase involved in cell wall biosynthesis